MKKIITKISNKVAKILTGLKKETPLERKARIELFETIKGTKDDKLILKNGWERYRQRIRQYILSSDPRNFLRWEPIIGSMFHTPEACEFDYLMSDPEKWTKAISETWVGNPPKYKLFEKSSGNLIHSAYDLSRLIDRFEINVGEVRSIIEYGAGYGSMAKLITDLGFKERYIIFDIPEFLALQKYYLSTTETRGNFEFIDKITDIPIMNPDIFIATWSISESPESLREEFLKRIGKPKFVLIAYQTAFESTDNVEYFSSYCLKNPEYEWINTHIDHIPGNYYLIGKKK